MLILAAMTGSKENSWILIAAVVFLLGLLVVLAGFQYTWVGQISDAERERMKNRLQDDTRRFAEDFDREMRLVYFGFQLNSEDIAEPDSKPFKKLLANWQNQTKFPELAESFYYLSFDGSDDLKFDGEKGRFEKIELPEKLAATKNHLRTSAAFSPILEVEHALAVPIYPPESGVKRIVLRTGNSEDENVSLESKMEMPEKSGVLIIVLNRHAIFERILPAISAKYFSNSGGADFKVAVTDSHKNLIFKTADLSTMSPDSTAKLFSVQPTDFAFFRKEAGLVESAASVKRSTVIKSESESLKSKKPEKSEVVSVNLQGLDGNKPKIAVFESMNGNGNGIWTLQVQHSAGSLEQFIENARRRNLAVSFGILGLLAASVILIFVSAQRSKRLAQSQLDFVSSVSHEFRTPLSVIYSAGENLTDGVVNSPDQVERYGDLITGEGKKLTAMVEQILQFAGARSGKQKYDFRETDARTIVENAVAECKPLLDENEFQLNVDLPERLPTFTADSGALSRAVQNLIVNAVKYSNGRREIAIAAKNGDGELKISVADKGIGISRKDLAHVFEPFYRAKSVVDDQIHGNGLGLNLVKEIVEAHKGKVDVESEVGKGSKFTIRLPIN